MELYRRLSFLGNSPIFLANTLTPIYENAENGALIKMGHGNTSTRNNNNKKYFTKTRQKSQRTCKAQILYTGRHLRPDILEQPKLWKQSREGEKLHSQHLKRKSKKLQRQEEKETPWGNFIVTIVRLSISSTLYNTSWKKKESKQIFRVRSSEHSSCARFVDGFLLMVVEFFFLGIAHNHLTTKPIHHFYNTVKTGNQFQFTWSHKNAKTPLH